VGGLPPRDEINQRRPRAPAQLRKPSVEERANMLTIQVHGFGNFMVWNIR
jgi:hypothetical protein